MTASTDDLDLEDSQPSLLVTIELDLPESDDLTRIHRLDLFDTSKQAEAVAHELLSTIARVVDKHKAKGAAK